MTRNAMNPLAITETTGFFDYIHDGHAFGWACKLEHPHEKVTIEILCGNNVVGRGIANIYRADLAAAGIGDGNHSFQIPLSYELHNGHVHTLGAREESTQTQLAGSPKPFTATSKQSKFDLISRAEGRILFSETIKDQALNTTSAQRTNFLKVFELASILQETGNLIDARFAWDVLAKKTNQPALLSCKLAETFMLEAQYDTALTHYKAAAGTDLKCVWAHLGISAACILLGYTEPAVEALEVALAMQPTNKMVRQRLIEIERLSNPVYINDKGERLDFYHLADLIVPLDLSARNLKAYNIAGALADRNVCDDLLFTEFMQMISKLERLVNEMEILRNKKTS